MSDEELGFVNAFIGFCTPSADTWPTPFVDGHYRVTGVEHQVVVTVNGEIRSPTPELISTSDVKQHCVILEAKSGSVNDRQARAYGSISARHLVNQSLATAKIDASQAVMDVLYICTEDNHERLIADFYRANVAFPIISYGKSKFGLVFDALNEPEMHSAFSNGIRVNPDHWPMHFVRCDKGSSVGQLASLVLVKCARLLLTKGEFDVIELCHTSIDFWEERGRIDQKNFRDRITSIVDEASKTELTGYFSRVKNEQRWKRASTKEWTPQAIDRFSEAMEAFVYRKQNGGDYVPGQISLFSL